MWSCASLLRVRWQPPTPPWRTPNPLQSWSPSRAPSWPRDVWGSFPPRPCRDSKPPTCYLETDPNRSIARSACTGTSRPSRSQETLTVTPAPPPSRGTGRPALLVPTRQPTNGETAKDGEGRREGRGLTRGAGFWVYRRCVAAWMCVCVSRNYHKSPFWSWRWPFISPSLRSGWSVIQLAARPSACPCRPSLLFFL